jgi:hypothetical protein
MARIKKAQVGKKLTVTRTREVADSLNKVGYKKIAAGALSRIASDNTKKSLIKGGSKDIENSERYKKLADKAEGKKMKDGGKSPAWQRKEGKNPSGGLNAKGVASYRAANPGSKLKTAVTTKPSKLKKGSKAASRRKSFCSRMSGMKKKLTSAKTANDPNSRINKSLRKWNC